MNKKNMSVMHKAALDNNTELIKFLNEKLGVDLKHTDMDGNTPMHFACSGGAEKVIEQLIGLGSDLKCVNNEGSTPLHLLITNADKLTNANTIEAMLKNGADRNITNHNNKKPKDLIDQIKN